MANIDTMTNLKEVVLGVLFISGDGIDRDFLAEKLDIDKKSLDKAIEQLKAEYSGDKGIHLICYKNKVQLSSNPNYANAIGDVLNPIREKSLTRAALETLAIIAYKQPVTKLEIEDVRRVNSDYAITVLVDQDMIEVVGRKDAVGKPLMFGTTENFLKRFNIEDLSQLPDYEEVMERISVIRQEEGTQEETLFRNVDDIDFKDDEIPEFLQGEQTVKIDGEDLA